ncbi:unnamed protein product, partial [Bubo scandiacus]
MREQRVQKLARRGRPAGRGAERSRAGRQRSPECRAAGARWNKQLATQARPSAPARRPAACRGLESAPRRDRPGDGGQRAGGRAGPGQAAPPQARPPSPPLPEGEGPGSPPPPQPLPS